MDYSSGLFEASEGSDGGRWRSRFGEVGIARVNVAMAEVAGGGTRQMVEAAGTQTHLAPVQVSDCTDHLVGPADGSAVSQPLVFPHIVLKASIREILHHNLRR